MAFDYNGDAISDSEWYAAEKQLLDDEQENKRREPRTTCNNCEKNLYEGDEYWGNNQIGTYCAECAEKEIEMWWGIIH